jgi:hypothetical protein
MRCSQVKEDFFLYEQRCSVGQALASHVRGQRKFNHEQENPGGSRRRWHSEPIRLHCLVLGIHNIQQLLFLDESLSKTTSHRGDYSFGHLPPTTTIPGKLLRHSRNLVIVKLFSSPILSPRDFTFRMFFSTTKVCPESLNLSSASDSFAGISSLIFCYLFSRPGT